MRSGADDAESRTQPKAEFHDIGKLIDWAAVGLHCEKAEPHEFERCVGDQARGEWGVRLEGSAAWRNIVRKDDFRDLRNQTWPDSRDWLYTSHADNLGAGFGRAISEDLIKAPPRQRRHCLWTGKESPDPRLKDVTELREMIQFLNNDPTWEKAEQRYRKLLLQRAETARPGLNVTTLLSHCRTVGKLARVLATCNWKTRPKDPWKGKGEREGWDKEVWSALYEIRFSHEPFRARDMHVFTLIQEAVAAIAKQFPDNVLAYYDNVIFAAGVSKGRVQPSDIESVIWKRGMLATRRLRTETLQRHLNWCPKCERPLRAREADGAKHKCCGTEFRTDYLSSFPNEGDRAAHWLSPPDLPERIEEPICEVCKMAHATKNWPTDAYAAAGEDEEDAAMGPEDLCEQCFKLRSEAPKLQQLAVWTEGALVWVHFRLDFELLRDALRQLAQAYLSEVPWKQNGKAKKNEVVKRLDVSLPVIVDFVDDYTRALEEIRRRLQKLVGDNNLEPLMNNLLAARLADVGPLEVMEACLEVLRETFPKLCKVESGVRFPIRVAFSASNVKHPFFQHWRYLQATEREVEFQLVNSGVARLDMADSFAVMKVVLEAAKHHSSSLHNLAMMAATQPALAQLALLDKQERGLKLDELADLVKDGKIDLESVRILANLASRRRGN